MSWVDKTYILIAIIFSCVVGVTVPIGLVVFGSSIDSFTNQSFGLCSINFTSFSEDYCPPSVTLTPTNFNAFISYERLCCFLYHQSNISFRQCNTSRLNLTSTNHDLVDQTTQQTKIMLIIGFITLISSYIRVTLLNIAAERQALLIRQSLFQSILKKDIHYFDVHKAGELHSVLAEDVNKIQDGIGNKFGCIIDMVATLIASFVIGKIKNFAQRELKMIDDANFLRRFHERLEACIGSSINITLDPCWLNYHINSKAFS